MSDRIQLNDEIAEEITGGTLKLKAVAGVGTVTQLDKNFKTIQTFSVTDGNLMNVANMLKGPYWDFEAGKRDEQCLAYMKAQHWIV